MTEGVLVTCPKAGFLTRCGLQTTESEVLGIVEECVFSGLTGTWNRTTGPPKSPVSIFQQLYMNVACLHVCQCTCV